MGGDPREAFALHHRRRTHRFRPRRSDALALGVLLACAACSSSKPHGAAPPTSGATAAPATTRAPTASGVPEFRIKVHVRTVNGAPPRGTEFSFWLAPRGDTTYPPMSSRATVTGTAETPWLTVGPEELKTLAADAFNAPLCVPYELCDMSTLALVVKGGEATTVLDGTIEVTDTGETSRFSAELFDTAAGRLYGEPLGLVAYRLTPDGTVPKTAGAGVVPHVKTFADFDQRYWDVIKRAAVPEQDRPRRFVVADRPSPGDSDALGWRPALENLRSLGINTVFLPPTVEQRALMKEAGVTRTGGGVYCPPGGEFDYKVTPACPGDPAQLDAWAAGIAADYRAAGFNPADLVSFTTRDEPSWSYPAVLDDLKANPVALERFRQFLRDNGLSPQDVGQAAWADVLPVGRSRSTGSVPERKLFYWSMRFLAWDSARHLADVSAAVHKAFSPATSTWENWHNYSGRFYNPFSYSVAADVVDSGSGAYDWSEFARLKGASTLWTEDWFGDANAYQWSYTAERLASAARAGGQTFGGYVVGTVAGTSEGGLLRKAMALVGHGAKEIFYYQFGPLYASTGGTGWSERAVESPYLVKEMAQVDSLLGRTEDLLYPGQPVRSPVAILQPRSAEVWDGYDRASQVDDQTQHILANQTTDYMAESRGLQLALQHANIPVEFIDEDDLTASGLAPYRVVYATEPNVPPEGQAALVRWAQAGGTLVTVSNAGTADRYNEPTSVLSTAGGIEEARRDRVLYGSAYSAPTLGKVVDRTGAQADVRGVRGQLVRADGAAEATFDDGSPAMLVNSVGAGRVVHYAFLPGLSYWMGSDAARTDKLPESFSPVLRSLVTRPVELAGVKAPVETGRTLVETPVLQSADGAAITFLNWTNTNQGTIQVRYRAPFDVTRVNSATQGDLSFAKTDDGITFTLNLGTVDVVRVWGTGRTP